MGLTLSLRSQFGFLFRFLFICATTYLSGCAWQAYRADPISINEHYQYVLNRSFFDPDYQQFLTSLGLKTQTEQFTLEQLSQALLYFNPDLEVSMRRIPLVQANKILAIARKNPMIQIPLEHHSDTSNDRSPWLIGLVSQLIYERKEKREARGLKADAAIEISRIDVEELAWNLLNELAQQYWDYHTQLKNLQVIEREIQIHRQVLTLLQRRQELGEASGFEINTARLNLQRVLIEESQFKISLNQAFQNIFALIGVNQGQVKSNAIITNDDIEHLIHYQIDQNMSREVAMHQRFDVQKSMLQYSMAEADLMLAIERQYPDIQLSPGFIFEQDDKIWRLATGWVLPLFDKPKRHIEAALLQRKVKQAEFMALQASIINQLDALIAGFQLQQSAYQLAQQLYVSFLGRQQQLERQLQLGALNRLDYVRSQLEGIELEQSLIDLQNKVMQSLISLQQFIQYPLLEYANKKRFLLALLAARLNAVD